MHLTTTALLALALTIAQAAPMPGYPSVVDIEKAEASLPRRDLNSYHAVPYTATHGQEEWATEVPSSVAEEEMKSMAEEVIKYMLDNAPTDAPESGYESELSEGEVYTVTSYGFDGTEYFAVPYTATRGQEEWATEAPSSATEQVEPSFDTAPTGAVESGDGSNGYGLSEGQVYTVTSEGFDGTNYFDAPYTATRGQEEWATEATISPTEEVELIDTAPTGSLSEEPGYIAEPSVYSSSPNHNFGPSGFYTSSIPFASPTSDGPAQPSLYDFGSIPTPTYPASDAPSGAVVLAPAEASIVCGSRSLALPADAETDFLADVHTNFLNSFGNDGEVAYNGHLIAGLAEGDENPYKLSFRVTEEMIIVSSKTAYEVVERITEECKCKDTGELRGGTASGEGWEIDVMMSN